MTQTDAEFVEAMAARARRQYPEGVQVVDHELERLVALAREGLRWRELAAGDEREVIALRQQLADAEARVRELEAGANEVEDALEVWSSMPCGCVPPKDGTHASLAELSKCLLDGAEARVRELTVRRAN